MRVLGQIHFNCTLFYVCTGPHCTTCFKIGKRWPLTLLNSSAIYNSTCAEKINYENGDCDDILEKVVLSEDSSQCNDGMTSGNRELNKKNISFIPWNICLWCSTRILLHCEVAEKWIFNDCHWPVWMIVIVISQTKAVRSWPNKRFVYAFPCTLCDV